jgi:apolipoprotein N-acyltransferase
MKNIFFAISTRVLILLSIWMLTVISFILISPKWTIPLVAWAAPAFLLALVRSLSPVKGFFIGFLALVVSSSIAHYEVAPLPDVIFVIFVIVGSLIGMLPYLADRLIAKRFNGFLSTLVFPCARLTLEYMDSLGNTGSLLSIANTQFAFTSFIQLASVTGIWGISFMIYWFAAVINWVIRNQDHATQARKGAFVYLSVWVTIVLFGALRTSSLFAPERETVRIAGVTVENFRFLEALYQDYFKKAIRIDKTISQSSPQLQEVNKALIPFIENPHDPAFILAHQEMENLHKELFRLSEKEAEAGAKIVLWSEANAFVLKENEATLIEKGRQLARTHDTYLLMAMGVILPGKLTPDRRFLENKTVLIAPGGKVVNTYFKNIPVPGVEFSVPGDGTIPVVATPYGNLSPVICYDADFTSLLKQTGQKGTDILLIPSGDWKAISPYHTYAALLRGIENGYSVVRQASGGLSAASDYFGNVLASMDFFSTDEKVNVAYVPTQKVPTIYNSIGDAFAYLCMGSFVGMLVFSIYQRVISSRQKRKVILQQV